MVVAERQTLVRSRRTEGAVPVALVAICVIGAVLRFASLSVQSFDFDESYTVAIVGGSLGHALHQIPITESTPPLYYVLAWLWAQVFGLGEAGLRSLSALLGAALIPVVFVTARRLGSARAGLIAAALVAVNPLMVWYSQEARSYSLLALLSALSFLAFVSALDDPRPRIVALWALASGLAVLTHYFAAFLVVPEALWLIISTRRRGALLAAGAVAAVGMALIPLILRQADNRADWIAQMSLFSRIKEVIKKWITGEISPTRNWQLAVIAAILIAGLVACWIRLSNRERHGVMLAGALGGAAVLIPLILELPGLHYLISKNVMAALTLLLIAAGLILGGARGQWIGAAGAGVGCAFFLALTVAGMLSPSLQRPDYRDAAHALGPPAQAQAVVVPRLGNGPLALYRPGAQQAPPAGYTVDQVIVVQPVPRADISDHRPPTPTPPAGFTLTGRRDTAHYTLICFSAPTPRPVPPTQLLPLAGGTTASVQVWPEASSPADPQLCSS